MTIVHWIRTAIIAVTIVAPLAARAADETGNTLVYEPDFFARYNPITAVDMVDRVPGFVLKRPDFGGGDGNVRGFGGAAGNVLINGKRPSTKSDHLVNILSRIAAEDVERIELIRGATGSLDAGQSSIVVNVVLREGTTGGSIPFLIGATYEAGFVTTFGNVSTSGTLGAVSFSVGINREAFKSPVTGTETFRSAFAPNEHRDEEQWFIQNNWTGSLSLEAALPHEQVLRINLKGGLDGFIVDETSVRMIEGFPTPELVDRSWQKDEDDFEIGIDYERLLGSKLAMKLIGLVSRGQNVNLSGLDIRGRDGSSEISRADLNNDTGETIGRIEFDWAMAKGHAAQFGGEVAQNFDDSEFMLTVDAGMGPVPIMVPGANTRISELRGEVFVKDSWTISPTLNLDLGFAFEKSRIRQTGDVRNSRSFTYAKPTAALTWSPSAKLQWRLRAERQVSQLNFSDFASSSNFEDSDVDLGNPDLRPERTWHIQTAIERRFGDIGVVEFRVFYDIIDDVEDLLPLGGIFESPGNIGDGKRWGFKVRTTVPLAFLGLKDGRLDATYRWQDSSVTDPTTGLKRILSREQAQELDVSFRHELPALKTSIGAKYKWTSDRPFFGVDETFTETEFGGFDVFIEKVVLGDLKLRFEADNLLRSVDNKDRTVFVGSRVDGLIKYTERRRRRFSRYYILSLSGIF